MYPTDTNVHYTCLCPEDYKAKFTLNLLRLGVKDWWKLVTGAYSHADKVAVTWEQFTNLLHVEYVPLVEREWLTQEYLSLKQTTLSVTEITNMFPKRSMLCPEYDASE